MNVRSFKFHTFYRWSSSLRDLVLPGWGLFLEPHLVGLQPTDHSVSINLPILFSISHLICNATENSEKSSRGQVDIIKRFIVEPTVKKNYLYLVFYAEKKIILSFEELKPSAFFTEHYKLIGCPNSCSLIFCQSANQRMN